VFSLILIAVALLAVLALSGCVTTAAAPIPSPTVRAPIGGDLALGDSIAVGTGSALGVRIVAKESVSSCWIAARGPRGHFAHAVVSAGVNAPGSCLDRILDRLDADHVTLILPAPVNSARAHVADVARRRGLATVSCVPGGDGLHPRRYPEVAAAMAVTTYGLPREVIRIESVDMTSGFSMLMGRQSYITMCIRAGVAPPDHIMESARRDDKPNRAERRRTAWLRRAR
jgi:hypothetical protein